MKFIFIPLSIFSVLLIPYLGLIPYLDGNTEFDIAYNFYTGNYFTIWMPYHFPLKLFLSSIFFHFFGYPSYTQLGFIFGFIGIVSIYTLAQTLFDKKTAQISSLLLALSGLYVSTSLFSLNDFLETVFILAAFACYVRKKISLYAVIITFAVMAKESALIFALVVVLCEIMKKKFRPVNILPFGFFGLWILFLHSTGHDLWNSWNFSGNKSGGILYTYINNLLTLHIFNDYAYGNWLHLFIFNYNWLLWIFALIAVRKIKIDQNLQIIILFIFAYTLINLSFQTYSIPRYILPVIVFVYIFVSFALAQMKYSTAATMIVFCFVFVSLFSSNDPVSNLIWGRYRLLDQNFYIRKTDGKDGVTYNMQFLYLTKERDMLIRTGDIGPFSKILSFDQKTAALYRLSYSQ